jgi:hypothetical protein
MHNANTAAAAYARLEAVLARCDSKLSAHEVHGAFLGALVSPDVMMGPLGVLTDIFGDAAITRDPPPGVRGVLDYWCALEAACAEDRVRLAPAALCATPTVDELRRHLRRRQAELRAFTRSVDEGGSDAITLGTSNHDLFHRLSASVLFLAELERSLANGGSRTADHCRELRDVIELFCDGLAGLIAGLILDFARPGNRTCCAANAGRRGAA